MSEVPGRLPLEMSVGVRPPSHWAEIEAAGESHRLVTEALRWGRVWRRPVLAGESIDWEGLNVVPRFVGSESTACVVALQPSVYHGEGADEFERFLDAAGRRGETALIVSTIGDHEDQVFRSVFGRNDASISLPGSHGHITGRRLPAGVNPELATDLRAADRDLALRLRSAAHAWWALELQDSVLEGVGGREVRAATGTIEPLLVNELGETLAGVWSPNDGRDWRWYIVPDGTDWNMLITWSAERAAPEFVPAAMRRARSTSLVDAELRTPAEVAALNALDAFEAETELKRARLEAALRNATEAAEAVRHDLLCGTGEVLQNAVAQALRHLGLLVEDLDRSFAGRSSDLLVKVGGVNCLVEVKSASGRASESMLDDLERHRRTFGSLGRADEIHRTALVVNHQTNLAPTSRASRPYERAEFVDSLPHVVVPALALYCWWRDHNVDAVADAFATGSVRQHEVDLSPRESPDPNNRRSAVPRSEPSEGGAHQRRRWRRASKRG